MSDNAQQKFAFVFPGQGSQAVGMLTDAYEQFEAVRDTFAEASQALGEDIWAVIKEGPQEALNMTATTQPVLLTSSVALWRAWLSLDGKTPTVMAGHSLGEFSALVCAGAIEFADAVVLVRRRGEFMQSAVPAGEGAMSAIIGLDDEAINRICQEVSAFGVGVVAAVNFNSPGQVVIAGHSAAVDAANEALKEAGAKRAMQLPVSAPFHTSLMQPAGERLAQVIGDVSVSAPSIPVVHNVHAQTESEPEKIRSLLIEQIHQPVMWTDCIQTIVHTGATDIVECGPGKVLTGLNRRIDKSLQSYAISEPDALRTALEALSADA